MADANPIRVSFDQQTAVRIRDGAKLKAVPVHSMCRGCAVPDIIENATCLHSRAVDAGDRCCDKSVRKDRNHIVWKEI